MKGARPSPFAFAVALVAPVALTLVGCGGPARGAARTVRPMPRPEADATREFLNGVRTLKLGGDVETRAMESFRRAGQQDSNLWEANYDLGVLLLRHGDVEEAVAPLRAAVDRPAAVGAAVDERAAIALGEALRRAGHLSDASSALSGYVAQHGGALGARNALVRILRQGRDYSGALHEAREVLVRDGHNVDALNQIGIIEYVQGQNDLAELVFKKALDLLANDARAAILHNNLGLVFLARGDDQAAFGEFARATEIDPAYATARLNRGAVLLRAGDFEGALSDYRAASSARPDAPEVQVGLGIALRGTNHPAEARAAWERALRMDRWNAGALFNLGVLAAETLHDAPGAADYMRRYLQVASSGDPKRAEAQRYIQAAAPRPASPPRRR